MGRHAVEEDIQAPEVEDEDYYEDDFILADADLTEPEHDDEPDLGECPWYMGTGICNTGCSTEPACETSVPEGGWPSADLEFWRQRALTAEKREKEIRVKYWNRVLQDLLDTPKEDWETIKALYPELIQRARRAFGLE